MKKQILLFGALVAFLTLSVSVNAFWWNKTDQRSTSEIYEETKTARELVESQFRESVNSALCLEFKALKDKIGDELNSAHTAGDVERLSELAATQSEVEANIKKACTEKSIDFNLVFDDPAKEEANREKLEAEIAEKQAQLAELGK